ncbi:MAG: hypothetical protein U0787_18920 [Polyangia bacterium]
MVRWSSVVLCGFWAGVKDAEEAAKVFVRAMRSAKLTDAAA